LDKKFLLSGIALSFLLVMGCKKEEAATSDIPSLELISIGPKQVVEFKDSVLIRLRYTDGDGDLGGVHPDSSNLFVVDNRIDLTYAYRIQELVPNAVPVPIEGTLDVVVNGLFLVEDSVSEEVRFSIYAQDKAGHRSNTVQTEAVLLRK
jgi:hypothetical protein